MRQRRNTILLVLALAAVLAVLYLFQSSQVPDTGLTVVIQVDGKKVHEMDLDTDAEYRAVTDQGDYNVVIVKDRAVMVSEADCANQVCVKTGWIHNPGEVIACLPHKLIIYLE